MQNRFNILRNDHPKSYYIVIHSTEKRFSIVVRVYVAKEQNDL